MLAVLDGICSYLSYGDGRLYILGSNSWVIAQRRLDLKVG